jgi:hypothetical protein
VSRRPYWQQLPAWVGGSCRAMFAGMQGSVFALVQLRTARPLLWPAGASS